MRQETNVRQQKSNREATKKVEENHEIVDGNEVQNKRIIKRSTQPKADPLKKKKKKKKLEREMYGKME